MKSLSWLLPPGTLALLQTALFLSLHSSAASINPSSGFSDQRIHLPKSGGLTEHEAASINGSDYPPSWITIPVDHFNHSDRRTFQNRFWMNDTFYKPGGPVFWFDAGEQNAQPLVPYHLAEVAGPSAVMTLARRFDGLALLFEHRYYGGLQEGSYPYPHNSTTGELLDPEGYAYLNTEQALEDTIYFANNFRPSGLKSHWTSLHPRAVPWIWLGGSYPGIRGAQLRIRNPETWYATWASSAPTQAAVDMWTYYAQAERSMTRNCSADFTAITNYVDDVLTNGSVTDVEALKIQLWTAVKASPSDRNPTINETEALNLSEVRIGHLLLSPFNFYQYYGFDRSVLPFCDILETQNRTNSSTTDNGGIGSSIAPSSGLADAYNTTTAWTAFLTALVETDYDAVNPPRYLDPVGQYSWRYQYCSEYGYYQRGNPDNPHTIESRFISLDSIQESCDRQYPNLLPASPDVSKPNKYGGWNMKPSNTMFTSGQYDPWRALSPASTEADSPKRRTVSEIPKCNTAPPEDDIFGLVYENAVHVSDMRALLNESDYYHQNFGTVGFSSPVSTTPFYAGVGLFGDALAEWLKCFGVTERKTELKR